MFSLFCGRRWQVPVLLALAVMPLLSVAAAPQDSALGEPVSNQTLSHSRGGYAIESINLQDLNANLSDNLAYGNVSGNNYLTEQAFSGASGVPTVIQNSGNNVIIQNATILNIRVQ